MVWLLFTNVNLFSFIRCTNAVTLMSHNCVQIVEKPDADVKEALIGRYPRLYAALFPQSEVLPQDVFTVYHLLKVVPLILS